MTPEQLRERLAPTGSEYGLSLVAGEPMIVHCHHYNVVLQQSIEDAGRAVGSAEILRAGAAIPSHAQLVSVLAGTDGKPALALAAEHFRACGFGVLDLGGLAAEGGTATLRNSHYVLGFGASFHQEARETPACSFAAGYLEAALAAAFGVPLGTYSAREVSCAAQGGPHCELAVSRTGSGSFPAAIGAGSLPEPMPERTVLPSNISEGEVLAALAELAIVGNEEGSIPAFGVYLTRHFANYYNYMSYELERRLAAQSPSLVPAAHELLVEAGHVCAFNTFGGIMESPEWDAVVGPMIRERADWVSGIVACINTLGWGRWSVLELAGGERLRVRVDASYESNYYLAAYGPGEEPRCYFSRGAVAGIMNLLYVGDVTAKPTLDRAYYEKLFSGEESFRARELKCRSKGDDCCELEATRHRYA